MTLCKYMLGPAILCLLGGAGLAGRPGAGEANTPADDLEYWIGQSRPAGSQPAGTSGPVGPAASTAGADGFVRDDAIPGVIELSDGRVLAGSIYTTRGSPLELWNERQKRWRRLPLPAALSITAVVVAEEMVQDWRWKGMGEPERVYTGRQYPTRRLKWRVRLADGSTMTGAIKGRPIWIESGAAKAGPFVLHERTKGKVGTTPADLIYVRRIVFSRRAMDAVAKAAKGDPNGTSGP